mgnify:CR=1 FL=1
MAEGAASCGECLRRRGLPIDWDGGVGRVGFDEVALAQGAYVALTRAVPIVELRLEREEARKRQRRSAKVSEGGS